MWKTLKAELIPLTDSRSTLAAARTISHSFSNDKLIQWLRPGAIPWGQLDHQSVRWQCRRVTRAIADGMVVGFTADGSNSADEAVEGAGKKEPAIDTRVKTSRSNFKEDYASVAILHPPQWSWMGNIRRTLRKLWVGILALWNPVSDESGDERRICMMLESHEQNYEKVRLKVSFPLWYIEVVAVHPLWQGKGVGGQVMRWVLEQTNGEPIFLECTDEKNVAFYRKFGFEVVDIVEFTEAKSSVKLWLMLKA